MKRNSELDIRADRAEALAGAGAAQASESGTKTQPPEVVWQDLGMATSFANVVNIQSTQEQIDLFFGMNQTWAAEGNGRVTVELNNRVIMSPHAAKRLWKTLGGVIQQYETRHGDLRVE